MIGKYTWPTFPYKGFSYYTRSDVLLFAGRDNDITRCGRFLASDKVRVLVLHGSTGCGKSSFLRAGLIPFLESGDLGFLFMRPKSEDIQIAAFVRCTDAPLVRLLESLQDFASRPLQVMTPVGAHTINLSATLDHFTDRNSGSVKIGRYSEGMIGILTKLAKLIPQTLIIVIDQAEEILTLKPGQAGQNDRDGFFDFLSRFLEMSIDIKLLIAIRTEYAARFANELQLRTSNLLAIPHFQLNDLSEREIIEAIERPTSTKRFPHYGSPHEHYKFSYADGLPGKIARELTASNPKGGILPVMQIVCDRLFKLTKHRGLPEGEWIITDEDYQTLGRIEGQVEAYISELLAEFCMNNGMRLERSVRKEIERWKKVLYLLTKEQKDGTVTTDIRTLDELRNEAANQFCELDVMKTLKHLSEEEQRVLRCEEVLNISTEQRIICYSLGHDAIGLALQKWKTRKDAGNAYVNRLKQVIFAFGRRIALLFGIFYLFATGIAVLAAIASILEGNPLEAITSALGAIIVAAFGVLCLHLSGSLPAIQRWSVATWRRIVGKVRHG